MCTCDTRKVIEERRQSVHVSVSEQATLHDICPGARHRLDLDETAALLHSAVRWPLLLGEQCLIHTVRKFVVTCNCMLFCFCFVLGFTCAFCRGASVAVMLGVILPFIIAAHRGPPGGPEKVH